MKRTVKKGLAAIITACMLLSVVCALGSAGIVASAAHPDYYEFTEMPGFGVWTDEELATLYEEYTAAPVHSTENAPEGFEESVKFTITSVDKTWGSATINSGNLRNKNTATSEPGFSWGAMSLPGGKSIVGDKSFADCDGICFWVGGAGGRYEGKMKMQMFLAECRGPFYDYNKGLDDGTNELGDAPIGYRYESTSKGTDADGYIFFDFDEDFRQVDWWATDDDGLNQSVHTYGDAHLTPIPEKVRETMNGITVCFLNVSVGTNIYIADIKGYKDTRVLIDNLDDAVSRFDSLNPDAYTEASYAAATDVYLSAVDMMMSGDDYTQDEIDFAARRLNSAIDSLDQLFPAKSETEIAGFEVWDDDDLLEMADGGVCTDVAYFEEGEDGLEICIISTASTGAPDYGWSRFISAIDEDGDGYVDSAIKNPFDADLTETAGLCFRVKYEGTYQPADIQLGVGVPDGPYFIACNPEVVFPQEPEREGIVYVAWAAFYDEEDEEDIYDYLDQLEYFEVRFSDSTQEQIRISNLYAFDWAINDADFTASDEAAAAAREELPELGERNYYPAGWEAYIDAIEAAEALPGIYAAGDDDVAAAVAKINAARNALIPIGDADYDKLSELHETYKVVKSFWYGSYTPSSGIKLTRAVEGYEKVMDTAISDEDADKLLAAFGTAVEGFKAITPKTIKDDLIYSFEDYTEFDLDYCMAFRSSGVSYSLEENSEGVRSLLMKTVRNLVADESGTIKFYPFYNDYLTRPLKKTELVKDLGTITGFYFDVEVNDLSIVKDASLSFGVLNYTAEKQFDKHAEGIALPASGKGRIYVPTTALTVSMEGGNAIALNNIAGYYFILNGEYKEGFEIKITNIGAYNGTTNAVPDAPGILNLTEGVSYQAGVIPEWTDGAAVLDGKAYVYGTPITVNGPHNLQVGTGKNFTEVNFEIYGGTDPELPPEPPVVAGVADGEEYEAPVAATWTPEEATATLNGEAYVAGTEISEPGEYVLVVTNGEESVTVAFTIKETVPPVAKGDMDGDGEITVADALKALRIAAKLVAPTADDLAIGDIDGDGEITVADALKILRVAAKLADSL